MSRLYFHSPSGTAELWGGEFHHLRKVAYGPAEAAWRLDELADIEELLAHVPDRGEEHYLHAYLREALAQDRTNKAMWDARKPHAPHPPTSYEHIHRVRAALRTHLRVNSVPLQVAGVALRTANLELNTALVAGSDVVRLAAKIAGWGAQHAYIEGRDRAWMADLIDEGLAAGIYRRGIWYVDGLCDGLAATHPDRQWADTGWEKVQVMLRECDDEPVVLSYSVEDDFPGPGIANWQPPPMPDGWAPDWAASEQGAVEWERDYPSAEDRLTCYREQAGDLWYELPFAQQWRMAMAGLRRERPWARLAPGTLTKYTFELGVSVYDWYAPDRDQRIQAAAAAAERDDT